jgi:hypothetical protein
MSILGSNQAPPYVANGERREASLVVFSSGRMRDLLEFEAVTREKKKWHADRIAMNCPTGLRVQPTRDSGLGKRCPPIQLLPSHPIMKDKEKYLARQRRYNLSEKGRTRSKRYEDKFIVVGHDPFTRAKVRILCPPHARSYLLGKMYDFKAKQTEERRAFSEGLK